MLYLSRTTDAVFINPNLLLPTEAGDSIIINYNPSGAYHALYHDIAPVSTNLRNEIIFDTVDETPDGTFFMVFGGSSGTNPLTSANSIWVEFGCIGGKFIIKMNKRIDDVTTTQTETTILDWYCTTRLIDIGLNAFTNKLQVRIKDGEYEVMYELAIPAYSFTRLYGFTTISSATPMITWMSIIGEISINDLFTYNKNKTTLGNMVDFIKSRTEIECTAADIVFSDVQAIVDENYVVNTQVNVSSSGTGVLTGSCTLEYARLRLSSFPRISDKTSIITLPVPYTTTDILAAYNDQFGMNLLATDLTISPAGSTEPTPDALLTFTINSNNLCFEPDDYTYFAEH